MIDMLQAFVQRTSPLGRILLEGAAQASVILFVSAAAAFAFRRGSAAKRNLIWHFGIVALLVTPILSAVVPRSRFLSGWMISTSAPLASDSTESSSVNSATRMNSNPSSADSTPAPEFSGVDSPPSGGAMLPPIEGQFGGQDSQTPSRATKIAGAAATSPVTNSTAQVPTSNRMGSIALGLLPLVWALGVILLLAKTLAARIALALGERKGTRVLSWRQTWNRRSSVAATLDGLSPHHGPNSPQTDPLVIALEDASSRLGFRPSITVSLHPDDSIPLVWGVLHSRLRLPQAARGWDEAKLRSVVTHELAHVKRRDTLALLLVRLAFCFYWFHPLIWFATWRLSVERERACDDLVLAGGVRPSTYAEHLLEVVLAYSATRWRPSLGLAMARPKSLEGRLIAVLDEKTNRHPVSRAVAIASLAICLLLIAPVLMLRAAEDDPGKKPSENPTESRPSDSATEQPKAEPQKTTDDPTPANGAPAAPSDEKADAMQSILDSLQWGEPANGLRAALIRPGAFGEPDKNEIFDFELVLWNVSETPIHFVTNDETKRTARLRLGRGADGVILAAFHDDRPSSADLTLAPGTTARIPLFSMSEKGESMTHNEPPLIFTGEFLVENAPPGAWTGKLATAATRAMYVAHGRFPRLKPAQNLFTTWVACARRNGRVPGAMIGRLKASVELFIKNNPTWKTTPALKEMLPSLDASRDWNGIEALALLDRFSEAQSTPVEMASDTEGDRVVTLGTSLPAEWADAPWGEPSKDGLRLAWLLTPRSPEHPLNTALRTRLLVHNAGARPVVFRGWSWLQGDHKAVDAKGRAIPVEAISWLTLSRLHVYRLAPGEFIEIHSTGVGVGSNKNVEDWQNTRVGSWIDAQPGDEITLLTEPIPFGDRDLDGGAAAPVVSDDRNGWWLKFIQESLARRGPAPTEAQERERLVYKVSMELFGNPTDADITASFVADQGAAPFEALAQRLANSTLATPFAGWLRSAPTKFRVLPVDPEAEKRPRVANQPGTYTLPGDALLSVSRRPFDERIVNEASVTFYPKNPPPDITYESFPIDLPDGYGSWAIAWKRDRAFLWLWEGSRIRGFDLADPKQMKEVETDPKEVPSDIAEALQNAISAADAGAKTKNAKSPPAATRPPGRRP